MKLSNIKLSLKRNIGKIWPANDKARKVILLYHSVGESIWASKESIFTDQIKWLYDHSPILSLTDLVNSQSAELEIAITFDDGYQSLYEKAMPIFLDKKIPATVYINTGWMSDHVSTRKKSISDLGHYPNEYFLTWDEICELDQAGWEIASHGVNHHNFVEKSHDVVRQECIASKYAIEERLNKSCLHFSYPWGQYSMQVKKIVRECGYQYAAAARHGSITHTTDLFALPRINIARGYSLNDFKHIVYGKWDYLSLLHKAKGL